MAGDLMHDCAGEIGYATGHANVLVSHIRHGSSSRIDIVVLWCIHVGRASIPVAVHQDKDYHIVHSRVILHCFLGVIENFRLVSSDGRS